MKIKTYHPTEKFDRIYPSSPLYQKVEYVTMTREKWDELMEWLNKKKWFQNGSFSKR